MGAWAYIVYRRVLVYDRKLELEGGNGNFARLGGFGAASRAADIAKDCAYCWHPPSTLGLARTAAKVSECCRW